jgi:type III restriction enzyme
LEDGRVLAVEYKGGNLDEGWYAMPDSEEKRLIGALWEGRSGGKCLFIMPQGRDFGAILGKVRGG